MDRVQAEDDDGPCLHALRTGDVVGVTDFTTDPRWPGSSRRAAAAGVRRSLSLPLATGNVVLGALNVYSDAPAAFEGEAATSLTAFAQQATTSLYIQDSLRTVLPEVAGLEMTGASVPSSPRAAVGGDWYDAFVLPDGSVGLVIGDVMGHGIAAVTAMAQIRTMVRTAARAGLAPGAVLQLVDQLTDESGLTETATVFHGNLRPAGRGMDLTYSNAEYPYPLVRTPAAEVVELSEGGRRLIGALGVGADPEPVCTATAHLAPGSLPLLFTDGLLERQDVDDEELAADLRSTLSAVGQDDSLEELRTRLLGSSESTDDTTVFVVRTGEAS